MADRRFHRVRASRAFPVNTGSPEMLYPFVLAALSYAEAIPLRLEMLYVCAYS